MAAATRVCLFSFTIMYVYDERSCLLRSALLAETIYDSCCPNLLYVIHVTALSNGDEAEIDIKIGTEWYDEDVS